MSTPHLHPLMHHENFFLKLHNVLLASKLDRGSQVWLQTFIVLNTHIWEGQKTQWSKPLINTTSKEKHGKLKAMANSTPHPNILLDYGV